MSKTHSSEGVNVEARMRARFSELRAAGECAGVLHVRVDRPERAGPDRVRAALAGVDELLREHLDRTGLVSAARADGRVVLVPVLASAELEHLAQDLVRAARRRGPTLSIGVAHDPERAQPELEILRGVADAGLEVARCGGGNRRVHTDQYAGVALHLAQPPAAVEEAQEHAEQVGSDAPEEALPQVNVPRPAPVAREPGSDQTLIESLRRALSGDAHAPRLARFQHALEGLLHEHPEQDSTHEQVDLLERRVHKLAAALELAEVEIARLRSGAPTETGVASIYREVQGLTEGEPLEAVKRELMVGIFEANAALQGLRDERIRG